MVVDADMDIFEADPAVLAGAAASDAMSGFVEAGEPLDVEMDGVAGPLPLVAADRRLGLEGRGLAEAEADQLRRDRGTGEPETEAISAAVSRQCRSRKIIGRQPVPIRPAGSSGREERSTRPEAPSARSRARHLRTVRTLIPKLAAAAARSSRLGCGPPEGLDCRDWSAHSGGCSLGSLQRVLASQSALSGSGLG